MVDGSRTGNAIQKTLARTGIGSDLLEEIDARRGKAPAAETRPPPAEPGAEALRVAPPRNLFAVVIEMNTAFPGGAQLARAMLLKEFLKGRAAGGAKLAKGEAALARHAVARHGRTARLALTAPLFAPEDRLAIANSLFTDHYLFAEATEETINKLGDLSIVGASDATSPIYKVWKDHDVEHLVFKSAQTIKCDAARAAFAASGLGIVWAVADTGVDKRHPHFRSRDTLKLEGGLKHRDFTEIHDNEAAAAEAALVDAAGHGTHVAGIIAGETQPKKPQRICIKQEIRINDTDNNTRTVDVIREEPITGLAPCCKIMSLKVLRSGDSGRVSYLLAAIGYLQNVNEHGRNIRVHGLNLSLGYPFLPRWFAAGQSPLCVEVNRLVRSGVVVVVAAGNGGYGTVNTAEGRPEQAAHASTISDPGNADLAITVGSVHRDMPHTYGVSFFSGKGPTADGRMKPDLVAPGERIVSCARMDDAASADVIPFREDSGTSMAAPHVSGAVAAFLSVRSEFIGQPERVKEILCANATDLKRKAEFQGAGLVDVLRSMQAV